MRCLVLGGGGFIGSHVCDELLAAGHHVRVFEKEGRSPVNILQIKDHIQWMEGDFLNPAHLKAAVHGIDIIFHFIGTTLPQSSNENPNYDITTNVSPTLTLLETARDAGVKKIIFSSSGGTVYGISESIPITEEHATEPICSYGIHKLVLEKYLALFYRLYRLEYCVMRISNAYGARQLPVTCRQGAVTVFLHKALQGEPIDIWGDGSVIRDYIYVSDAARAAVKLIETDQPTGIFNIGSGSGVSLRQLVSSIEEMVGNKVRVRYKASRVFDVPTNVLDISRAKQILGWKPEVDLKTGIAKTMDYLLSIRSGGEGKTCRTGKTGVKESIQLP